MTHALRLAQRGRGRTSPNPMVGAVLVKRGGMIGQGWHRKAGLPHAEVDAIRDALARGHDPKGATLYVTLEPCSTHGRTPPCTEAILAQRIARVVVGATDPNPRHAGRGYELLRAQGVSVLTGIGAEEAMRLNEAFNYWVVHRRPWVIVKAAMSLDGKIATASGESKWITGEKARAFGMTLRRDADAILAGVNTVLADDPRLTFRRGTKNSARALRRIILDAQARTPLHSQVLNDLHPEWTTIVSSAQASPRKLEQLAKRAQVLVAPAEQGRIDLDWLLDRLGQEEVTHLLVEGGGEVHASFLLGGYAQRIAFFYAPKILGGRAAPGPVGGVGVASLAKALPLLDVRWRRLGADLLLTARVDSPQAGLSGSPNVYRHR
jgi:diaminohydroxyphosphoribosylaminopyrimidine deaminase/5-amino-6-(5-phosphoribosylamino)uracil reductase